MRPNLMQIHLNIHNTPDTRAYLLSFGKHVRQLSIITAPMTLNTIKLTSDDIMLRAYTLSTF